MQRLIATHSLASLFAQAETHAGKTTIVLSSPRDATDVQDGQRLVRFNKQPYARTFRNARMHRETAISIKPTSPVSGSSLPVFGKAAGAGAGAGAAAGVGVTTATRIGVSAGGAGGGGGMWPESWASC